MRAFVLLFFATLAFPSGAFAQQESGVVLTFQGRGSSRVRGYVVRALTRRAELLPVRDAERAAATAGAELGSPEGIRAMAAALGADFAVSGEVNGSGRRARVTLRMYDSDGREVSSQDAEARPGARGRRTVSAAATELFDSGIEAVRSGAERRAREAREAAEAQAAAERADDDVLEDEDEEPEGPGAEHPLPRLRALVAVQARDRVATIDFGEFIGSRGYNASFHSELGVHFESFPFGSSAGAARGLYVDADFSHSVSLSSVDEDGSAVDTKAWRLRVQLGYLYPIADDFLRLGPIVGFATDRFVLGDNNILKSSSYSQLRAGLSASFRVYEKLLRVRIDGAYRYLFGVGDDFAADFGEDVSAWGLDFSATFEGQAGLFTYGLQAGVTRYAMTFDGAALVPEANSAASVDGTDRSFYLTLMAGVAFE